MAGSRRSFFSLIRYIDEMLCISSDTEEFRVKTYKKLKSFAYSGVYSSYKNACEFLSIENKSANFIASSLGVSKDTVFQIRKRLSDSLYELLGDDVADVILNGTERNCKSLCDSIDVLKKVNSDVSFILDGVKRKLEESYIGDIDASFDLIECKNELIFLSLFTTKRFVDMVSKLDSEKINYLLRIISGDIKNSTDRNIVLKFLDSNDNTSSICSLLNELS